MARDEDLMNNNENIQNNANNEFADNYNNNSVDADNFDNRNYDGNYSDPDYNDNDVDADYDDADYDDNYVDEDYDDNYEDYDDEPVGKRGKGRVPKWLHLTFIALIVLILAFSIYKLVKWNLGGTKLELAEGDFDVEIEDQIFLLSEDKKAGHEYDDEETILVLGNDAITYDAAETGVVGQVAAKTGATCYNCGYPSSTVALKNGTYSDDYALDAFNFSNVCDAIVNEDYSNLFEKAKNFSDYTYTTSTQTLSEIDFNKVDTIVIFYDAQDYLNLRIGMNPDNDQDTLTYSGALTYGITKLQEKYPYIRIVCMSFIMCYAYNSEGKIVSGDRVDFGNGKLTTYRQFMIDVSGATGVSFIDNYYGTIHEDNSGDWLLDNIHVNAACNEHMAEHFISAIYPNGVTSKSN